MSTAAPAASLRGRLGTGAGAALVGAVGVATVVAGVASGGNPALTLAPVVLAAVLILASRVPLRWSSNVLVFLLLALDATGDAEGFWASPLAPLGDLLTDTSGRLTGVPVAGFELGVLFLLAVAVWRRSVGSTVDGALRPMPGVVRDSMILYLAAFAYAAALGLAMGTGFPVWKARNLLHIPLLYAFFRMAYRGAADLRAAGAAVVAAALVKALVAAWVQKVAAIARTGGPLACATSHGDSILFAMAILILLAAAAEGAGRHAVLRAALLVPLPLWALVLNRRRIGWAMLEVGMVTLFLMSPWRWWKRTLVTGMIVGAPLILLYLAIGWNRTGPGLFGPVYKVRSMLDSKVDSSKYWREVEDYNVARTLRSSPLLGIGLGGRYVEHKQNDDISGGYKEYREWPHNTVLGLLLLTGVFGFFGLWMWNLVTVFLAARAYRWARRPADRAAALACVGAIVCCCFLAWGDTGAHYLQYKLAAALSLALAGKLAIDTGAWPAPTARRPAKGAPGPGGLDPGPAPIPLSGGRRSGGTTA